LDDVPRLVVRVVHVQRRDRVVGARLAGVRPFGERELCRHPTRSTGPRRNARPPSIRTDRSPPGNDTTTSPSPCVAAATATALVPDDSVSPAPRSQTRAVTRPGPSTRTTWTFVRFGNRGCV